MINQNVAILIDGNNIERSLHTELGKTNVMMNFDSVIERVLGSRNLTRLIYFKEGSHISPKLEERLRVKYYGSVFPCYKSADIPLAIRAMQIASKVDTIIIFSGDCDYVELIRHLKSEGIRVEIAGVDGHVHGILKKESDYCHFIGKDDTYEYKKQHQPYQQQRQQTDLPTNTTDGKDETGQG